MPGPTPGARLGKSDGSKAAGAPPSLNQYYVIVEADKCLRSLCYEKERGREKRYSTKKTFSDVREKLKSNKLLLSRS